MEQRKNKLVSLVVYWFNSKEEIIRKKIDDENEYAKIEQINKELMRV